MRANKALRTANVGSLKIEADLASLNLYSRPSQARPADMSALRMRTQRDHHVFEIGPAGAIDVDCRVVFEDFAL